VTRKVAGVWNGRFSCKDALGCDPVAENDEEEQFTFTQTCSAVDAPPAAVGALEMHGVLCGDYFVWTGGTSSFDECGTLRFLDDDTYVKTSCYQEGAGAACAPPPPPTTAIPNPMPACAANTGSCTNTGKRAPGAAASVPCQ
jgi:hypothetical protein